MKPPARLVLLLALAVSALSAAPASARLPVDGLTAHFTACPAVGGSCSTPETGEIWIAPDDGKFEFWHELGHVFDYRTLDDTARAWFTHQFGRDGQPWESTSDAPAVGGRATEERFADAFALCHLHPHLHFRRRGGMRVYTWETSSGYLPTPRQHTRICNAIAVFELTRPRG